MNPRFDPVLRAYWTCGRGCLSKSCVCRGPFNQLAFRPEVRMRRVIVLVLVVAIAIAVAIVYFVQSEPTATSRDCLPDDVQQTQQVITEQTQAMTAQDFAVAREFGTKDFRDNVSDQQFADIIKADYAFLTENPQIVFTACESYGPGLVLISARFTLGDNTVHQLDYAMVSEFGGWFINSASNPNLNSLTA